MESPWEQPKEWMLRTQQWPRLMKTSISQSWKLQLWLKLPKHVNLHVTDWVTAEQEDPILKTMIKWISNWKVQDVKPLLGDDAKTEEGKNILQDQKKLAL